MSEVDLQDLRIAAQAAGGRRGAAWPLLVLALVIGGAAGYAGSRLLSSGGGGVPHPAGTSVPDPLGAAPAADPGPAAQASFTEGGWIEVPSYHPIVVSSLVPGRLEELKVLEGTRVAKGDVIAKLYDKDQTDAVAQAEAEAQAAEAVLARLKAGFRVQEVEQARAELAAAEAELALKEKVLERTRLLLPSGAVSAEDLDRDEADWRRAKAGRDSLEQDLRLKEEGSRIEDIREAEAEYQRRLAMLALARNQLAYTVVTSPAAGVVLERFVTPGTTITAEDRKIVSLYDPGDLQVRVDVRQENIGSVFVGQEVEVFTDAEPGRAYHGAVIRLEPMADFKKNTIQVKVKLSDPSDRLWPEMIARIRFKRTDDAGVDGQG